MNTLLDARQILLRKEIELYLETADRGRTSKVWTREFRRAFLGPERTLLERVLALDALSRRDPGAAGELAGGGFDRAPYGPVCRSAVLLGKTDGGLDDGRRDFDSVAPAGGFRFPSEGRSAQEITDLITDLETARFMMFRAACLADVESAAADVEAVQCEKLAIDISERAAAPGRGGSLREGERP